MTTRAPGRAPSDAAPEPERVPRQPPTSTPPVAGTPAQLLALQRAAGNAAVSRALGRRMLLRDAQSDEVVEAIRGLPGGEYEFKLEHKGERASWSIRFSMLSSKTVLKQKADDVGKPGPSAGDTSATLLPTKMTYAKSAGAGASRSMAAALAKADLTIAEIVPGLTITADIKALEAKLEKGDIDVNVFKVGVQLQGALSKDMAGTELGDAILDTGFGELLKGGLTIKVQGRFEVGIDPSDLVRLQRMVQLNRQIAENVRDSVAQRRKLDAIELESKKIRNKLKNRDLSKQARKQLQARAKRNADKLATLRKGIAGNKKAMQGLKTAYGVATKGLKTKAGRIVGTAVKRIGGALLKRLVPGLNIVFAVLDVLEVGAAIWKLINGKATLGLPTGEEGEEGEGGEGEGETGGAEGDAGGGGAEGTGGEPSDAGLEHDADLPEGDLGPEISLDDAVDAGGPEAKPHAAAEQVLKALAPEDGGTPMDVEQLNALIPPDLSAEELMALLQQLKGKQGKLATDPFAVMEAVQRAMDKVRPTAPVTTAEDASGSETLPEAAPAEAGKGDAKAAKGEAKDKGTGGGEGKGKGAGLEDDKTGGEVASGKLRFVKQLDFEGVSLSQIQFTVLKGMNAGTRTSTKPKNITIVFDHEGVQRTITFPVVVTAANRDGDITKIEATNAKTWEIAGTGLHMRAGETLRMSFTK